MKSLLRTLAIVAGVFLLLLGMVTAYLALVFDINDYRDQLTAEVRKQTGRELMLDGRIGLSVFPWLGVEMESVRLGDAPGFGDQPFVAITRLEARARLLPLLSGQVDVDRIRVEGLALKLVRDAQGRFNWSDLVEGSDDRDADARTGPGSGAGSGGGGALLALGGLEVLSGSVSWLDQQQGVSHSVSGIDLIVDAIRPGQPFDISLGFDARSDVPALQARVELTAQISLMPEAQRIDVTGLQLSMDGEGAGVPGGRQQLRLATNMALDGQADTLKLTQFVLDAAGVRVVGQIDGSAMTQAPSFTGNLQVEEFSPRTVLAALGEAAPDTRDAAVLTRASASMRLDATADRVMLSDLEMRLDDSRLTGEAGLAEVSRQALRFDLALDAIDIDRYLPPDAPKAAATPGAVAGAAGGEASPEALRSLDVQGKLVIGKLTVSGLKVSDIQLTLQAKDGVLRLSPLIAGLYGGSYTGNISLDARPAVPRLSLDETLSGLQIEPFLADLTGAEARLSGRGDVKLRLQADGLSEQSIRRSLSGNASLRFADGAIKGVNVAQFLREASARLRGQAVPPESSSNQTDFSDLSASFKIASGLVRNDDLSLRSPLLRVSGAGSANLVSEQVDYLIGATLVGTLEGQGGAERDALRGVTVPIRVSGSFADPSYALDVETLIRENLSSQVRDRVQDKIEERVLDRAPAELQDSLREGLRGLLR